MTALPTYITDLGLPYTPSHYQLAVAKAVREGRGHVVVDAKAGAGKTSLIVDILVPLISGTITVGAFNGHIKGELAAKLSSRTDVTVKTINGIGHGAVSYAFRKKLDVDKYKYNNLLRDMFTDIREKGSFDGQPVTDEVVNSANFDDDSPTTIDTAACKLLDLVRQNVVDPSDWAEVERLADHHAIALEP